MVHKMILLISQAPNYEQLPLEADQDLLASHCRKAESKVTVDFYSRNRAIGREEQLQKIHGVLGRLGVKGQVSLKEASIRYQLLELHDWHHDHHLRPSSETMRHVFFGIELCSNHQLTAKFNYHFELRRRIYLGPTSTDNDLAFLMCNQALLAPGSLVLDPFVGTGGLLIPPASRGAITFGSDLDIRVLNGYSVGRINTKSPFYDPLKKY
jgi:tRNA G10  N-methylase Trm11